MSSRDATVFLKPTKRSLASAVATKVGSFEVFETTNLNAVMRSDRLEVTALQPAADSF